MKKVITLVINLLAGYFAFSQTDEVNALSFLHASGQNIVNESGQNIYLRGVGLGNWLLPEGYMWKFGSLGDRPRKIEKVIADLIGDDKAKVFWKSFRQNYITEADVKRIADLGFNSVRPALNARLFLTEGDHPVYIDEGFQLIDSLVAWCTKHKLYVILDMHAAPGGQTGANIDDSRNDSPELFIDAKYQDELVNLWIKIAQRYKDEPAVAAYDLLNEPLPPGTEVADKYKNLLVPLYQRITSAIRKVDPIHMITVEGYEWSNNWSLFDTAFDNNIVYQFHYYCWNKPDNLNPIDEYLRKREELNAPVWVGETGEKDNTIYWATAQYFASNNVGFSFWPWKKMDTKNTPYSIKRPNNWDLISTYTEGGAKPDSMLASKILNELLENIKIANCKYYRDVCNAILTRVPGKIEAENFGFKGRDHSYFTLDSLKKAAFYRANVTVPIILDKNDEELLGSEQSIELQPSEWVMYDFSCLDNSRHQLTIRASATDGPALLLIIINHKKVAFNVTSKELKELTLGYFNLIKGENSVKILVQSNKTKLDWLRFN